MDIDSCLQCCILPCFPRAKISIAVTSSVQESEERCCVIHVQLVIFIEEAARFVLCSEGKWHC
jgi:hypothetical protein